MKKIEHTLCYKWLQQFYNLYSILYFIAWKTRVQVVKIDLKIYPLLKLKNEIDIIKTKLKYVQVHIIKM